MIKKLFLRGAGVLMAVLSLQIGFAATIQKPANWGTPDEPWGTRRPVTANDRALIASYRSGHKQLTFSSDFNDPAKFHSEWQLLNDDKAGLRSCRRVANDQLSPEGLRLRTLGGQECKNAQWSTGSIASNYRQKFGFFEARMRIADTGGMNNAFWMTTPDHFEIDIAEVRFPNYLHLNVCNWAESVKDHCVGIGVTFVDNFAREFHDFGVLWTPQEVIFEVDGDPVGVIKTAGAINGAADIRFASALGDWAGKLSEHPEGHDFVIRSVRAYGL